MIERFSIECRKTKTKAISLAKNGVEDPLSQSKLELIACS